MSFDPCVEDTFTLLIGRSKGGEEQRHTETESGDGRERKREREKLGKGNLNGGKGNKRERLGGDVRRDNMVVITTGRWTTVASGRV